VASKNLKCTRGAGGDTHLDVFSRAPTGGLTRFSYETDKVVLSNKSCSCADNLVTPIVQRYAEAEWPSMRLKRCVGKVIKDGDIKLFHGPVGWFPRIQCRWLFLRFWSPI